MHIEIYFLYFVLLIVGAIVVGYLINLSAVNKLKGRVLDVEDETLLANKEVLSYVEENKQLKEALEKAKIPLPTLSKTGPDDNLRTIPLEKIG
jgi:hypothetical protein